MLSCCTYSPVSTVIGGAPAPDAGVPLQRTYPGVWPRPLAAPRERRRSGRQQRHQVQRVAGPRVDRLHAERPFHFHGGAIGLLHHPIDPHLPDPPTKGLPQPSGELVGHRTRPGDPTEASRQAECLRLADGDGELLVASRLLQHDARVPLVVSCAKPDDLAICIPTWPTAVGVVMASSLPSRARGNLPPFPRGGL